MIFVTGDTHGQMERFRDKRCRKLKEQDTLIICGDFGFIWDGSRGEEKALSWIGKRKYRVLFVDGKHENFTLLQKKYQVEEIYGGKAHHITGNLYHLMRGEIYTIEGKKVFAFGGGESVDKEFRLEQGLWWEEEMPTLEEMQNGIRNLEQAHLKVDYIITHEPPARALRVLSGYRNDSGNALDSFFEEIAKEVSYQKWFFGSAHQDKKVSPRHFALFREIIPAEAVKKKKRW